jgi:hypothetical protein
MRSRIGFLLVLLLSSASDVAAASMATSTCERYWASDIVFVGRVTEITRIQLPSRLPGVKLVDAERVRLSVAEAFRGVTDPSFTVTNFLFSEAAEFRVGASYFVYAAYGADGEPHTSLCAGTRPLEESFEDVRYARWIQTPRTRGRVFGTVSHSDWDPAVGDYVSHQLPAGLLVSLSGPGGAWRVRPEREGAFNRFLFDDVPPGTYSLTIQVDGPYDSADPVEVSVQAPGLCYEADLALAWKGVIRGRAIDAAGRPVPMVPVMVVSGRPPLDLQTVRFDATVTTDGGGEFTHRFLPPGEYTLGMYIDATSRYLHGYPTVYFPGVTDAESALAITVTAGSEIDVGDLQLPFDLEKVPVSGSVLLPDGSPCADCRVVMRAEGEYNDAFETTLEAVTDGNGSFQLPGVQARRYRVGASAWIHQDAYERSLVVTAGRDESITLRLEASRP